MANEKMHERIEPLAHKYLHDLLNREHSTHVVEQTDIAAHLSIAISLKRIADALEHRKEFYTELQEQILRSVK